MIVVLVLATCVGVLLFLALTEWSTRRNYKHHDAEMERIYREHSGEHRPDA